MSQNKKRKISSCFLCQKDNEAETCDGVRPCSRCVRLGVPHMCIGIDLGSPSSIPSRVAEKSNPPPPTPAFESMIDPFAGRAPSRPASSPSPPPEAPVQHPPQPSPVQEPTPVYNVNSHAMQEDPPAGSEQIGKKQNNLNIYFMTELKKLKGDQKRLDDEVLHLKLENSNLSARLKTSQWQVMRLMDYFSHMADHQQQSGQIPTQRYPAVTSGAMEATNPPGMPHLGAAAAALPKGRAEQPMVVYDLSKSIATVLTANTTFCQMIGYELNEVVGMPWTEFIPPEAARRTMNTILQQKNISSVIHLDQVYKHRTGGLFATYDTHTILFGNDGMPISDFVTLHFPESVNGAGGGPPTPVPPPQMRFLSSGPANSPDGAVGTARSPPLSRRHHSHTHNHHHHLSPASIHPLSSPGAGESPSDDEYEFLQYDQLNAGDPMISGAGPAPHAQRPHSAPVFGHHQAGAGGTRGGPRGRSVTPQNDTTTTTTTTKTQSRKARPRPPKGEQTSKLRDSIPKASMSVLDDDEDEGPDVQQMPFDEVLARRRIESGPTSIFHMPLSSSLSSSSSSSLAFPSLSSPLVSPFPPSPAPGSYVPISASPPAFSFDESTPMGASPPPSSPSPPSSSSSSSSASYHYSRASPQQFYNNPPTASNPSSYTAVPHYVGPNVIPLPPALAHHQQPQPQHDPPSSADIASVEDAFNELDLDPSFMPFSLDEDFLNSLLAPSGGSGGGGSSGRNGRS